jgi:hypothetical protein
MITTSAPSSPYGLVDQLQHHRRTILGDRAGIAVEVRARAEACAA